MNDSTLPPDLESRLLRAFDLPGAAPSVELEALCTAHPELAAELRLRMDELRRPAQGRIESGRSEHGPQLGMQLGSYRLLALLGEGGMGSVFLAEQRTPVIRRVALKVIKLGMDSRAVLTRFEAERQALAMMEHSCIAKVLDVGVTDAGQPYFAMEYVQGIPITEYCDQNRLGLRERIELFRAVCSGVQHAHMKGVMHRDLKPGNVLVTVQDGTPTPKIIDFGLAKAMNRTLTEATLFTEHGVIMGTPEYMSPEQAGLGGLGVDTRTDVYSLGVLLYELLVGDLPFPREELAARGMLEMQRVIREVEPPRASTKVTAMGEAAAQIAHRRRVDVAALRRRLRGDLDWILMRTLEKDRTRRYQTAHELAEDLGRHLALEPVLAGPPGAGYRLRKMVRRHRGVVTATAAVFVTLVGGLVVSWRLYGLKDDESRRAGIQERKAEEAQRQTQAALSDLQGKQTQLEEQQRELRRASQRVSALRVLAESRLRSSSAPTLAVLLAERVAALAPALDGNRALLAALGNLQERRGWSLGPWGAYQVAFDEELRHVYSWTPFPRGRLAVHRLPNGELEREVDLTPAVRKDASDWIRAVSQSRPADRRWFSGLSAAGHRDALRLIDTRTLLVREDRAMGHVVERGSLKLVRTIQAKDGPGKAIDADSASLWRLESKRLLGWPLERAMSPLEALGDPTWAFLDPPNEADADLILLTALRRVIVKSAHRVAMFDLDHNRGHPIWDRSSEGASLYGDLWLAPDGRRAILAESDSLALLSLTNRPVVSVLPIRVRHACWGDAKTAFIVDDTRTLQAVDTETLRVTQLARDIVDVLRLNGTSDILAIRADGLFENFGADGSHGSTIRLRDIDWTAALGAPDSSSVLLFAPDGTVCSFDFDRLESSWKAPSDWLPNLRLFRWAGDPRLTLDRVTWLGNSASRAFVPGGQAMVGQALLGDRPEPGYVHVVGGAGEAWPAGLGVRLAHERAKQRCGLWRVFSADGSLVLTRETGRSTRFRPAPSWTERSRILDALTGRQVAELADPTADFGLGTTAMLGHRRTSLLVADSRGRVGFIPDVRYPTAKTLCEGGENVRFVDSTHDEKHIVVGTDSGGVRVVEATGAVVFEHNAPQTSPQPFGRLGDVDEGLIAGAFSPDGTRLILLGAGGETWIHAVGSPWTEVFADTTARSAPTAYAFQEDGSHIAIGYNDGTVRVLATADGTEVRALRPHLVAIAAIAFSVDGTQLGSGSLDGTAKVFTMATGEQTHEYPHDGVPFLLGFGADGKTLVTNSPGHWHFWPLNLRELAAELKPRDLTDEELAEFDIPTGK